MLRKEGREGGRGRAEGKKGKEGVMMVGTGWRMG
jgi:hypothetical protein